METQQQRRKRIKRPKKRRQGRHPKEDRISSLPDSLLIHILSLLPTTKDAVRTGILSKRWLHMWTHLPVLIFDLDCDYKFSHFANHVDKTLTLHASPNLCKFNLSLPYLLDANRIADHLLSWLRFATLRQAQDMSLCFLYCNVLLPQFFYSNPWLRELKVQACDLEPTGKVEWTSLRVLEIGSSSLSEKTLDRILSGSPLLESLKLYDCCGIHEVDIGSSCSRLKTLVVDNIGRSPGKRHVTCLLSGSSIQHLEIYGDGFQKWEVGNMPSLVSVKLDFWLVPPEEEEEEEEEDYGDEYHEVCRKVVRGLLEKVGHAEQLELGKWCIQVLSTWEVKGVPAPVMDCKLLIFKLYDIYQWSLPGMASLLCSSSNLEKLAIDISRGNFEYEFDDPDFFKYEFEDNYWRSNKRTCNCLLFHLKIVEIFSLRYHQYEERLLFQLIEFLLKNAMMLEKMVVHQDHNWFKKDVVRMSKELLSFPRSSPCAVVKTHEQGYKV